MLHSILFHRLFGTVKPKTFEVLDVTMVRVCFRAAQCRVYGPSPLSRTGATRAQAGFECWARN